MIYRFGDCELDAEGFAFSRRGEHQPVEPQVFELLLYLVRHRNRMVTREELALAIWRGRMVADATINSRIRLVRRAIGDTGRAQTLIRTLHGHGFRFTGRVDVLSTGPESRRPARRLARL